MKSDIFTHEHGIDHILAQAERLGAFCDLNLANTGKLRLLTEEVLGLTVRLFENLKYEFYIENNERQFILRLSAKTLVNQSQKDKMISLSSNNENKAEKGFFGKLSSIFESLIMEEQEYDRTYIPYYDNMGEMSFFALSSYNNEHPKEPEERWDGLEKSIIATLAKDVSIGVRLGVVEMTTVIEF
ncbi:MAG: hypothetical protein LBD23_08810 [Oscillospiraceae bacterium]|jgi:hypothetical protein|nr:hypothetical protein [Oscillospiraceae bacterium]